MIIYPIKLRNFLPGREVDKVQLLKRLCRAKFFPSLSEEELKLYLILLVFMDEVGCEKAVDFETLWRALGPDLNLDKLKRIGAGLETRNLATISLQPTCLKKDSLRRVPKGRLLFQVHEFLE